MTVYSLFPSWQSLSVSDANDGIPLTLGAAFRVTEPGSCTGIEFQAANPSGGSDYVAELWQLSTPTTGTLLASKTIPAASIDAGNWNFAEFDDPVPLLTTGVYVAAFHNELGLFRVTDDAFLSTMEGTDGVVVGLQDGSTVNGITVLNGMFVSGGPEECPDTGSPNSAFYWVQPFFDDTLIPSGNSTGAMLTFFGSDR